MLKSLGGTRHRLDAILAPGVLPLFVKELVDWSHAKAVPNAADMTVSNSEYELISEMRFPYSVRSQTNDAAVQAVVQDTVASATTHPASSWGGGLGGGGDGGGDGGGGAGGGDGGGGDGGGDGGGGDGGGEGGGSGTGGSCGAGGVCGGKGHPTTPSHTHAARMKVFCTSMVPSDARTTTPRLPPPSRRLGCPTAQFSYRKRLPSSLTSSLVAETRMPRASFCHPGIAAVATAASRVYSSRSCAMAMRPPAASHRSSHW